MWLSEQFAGSPEQAVSGFGEVTIGGASPAVKAAGREQRLLPVISPGGYAWLPASGERVLVLDGGGACVAGRVQPETALSPGDVMLYAGKSTIQLCTDGTIRITGRVFVNGEALGGTADGD